MSDDEYYYDPEYEDFQDMLYDADPNPDLADDLAEHASYSPIWQDNPAEELRDYFSDWEYYSDDYFDDDPSLLNDRKRINVRGPGRAKAVKQPAGRGKKRRLSEPQDETPNKKRIVENSLTQCFTGVVWKSQSPDHTAVHQKGTSTAIALRLNDDIMRSAYNQRRGFGKGRLKRDESWANDLSLADMGLKAERTMSMHEQPEADGENNEEDSEYEGGDVELAAVDVDEEAVETELFVEEPNRIEIQTDLSPAESKQIQTEINAGRAPKKRKKGTEASSDEHSQLLERPQGDDLSVSLAGAQKGISKRTRQSEATDTVMDKRKSSLVTNGDSGIKNPGKRKVSSTQSSVTESTASSRAKRVKKDEPDTKPASKPAVTTRTTRSRKNK